VRALKIAVAILCGAPPVQASLQADPSTFAAFDVAAALQKSAGPTNRAAAESATNIAPWSDVFSGIAAKLKGLHLAPKLISDDDGNSTMGLDYEYNGYWKLNGQSTFGVRTRGTDITLDISGTAVFGDEAVPENLTTSKVAVQHFWNSGIYSSSEAWIDGDKLAGEVVRASAERRAEIIELLKRGADPALYVSVDANGGTESDARFTSTSVTYGASLVLNYANYDLASLSSKANIFDYPFALTRWLTSYDAFDRSITPRGTCWPVIRTTFDMVHPDDGNPRADVGDDSDFPRMSVEAAIKSPFARVGDSHLLAVMSYRHYWEIDASSEVRRADLDEFGYFAAGVETESGWFATYRTGRLPFDEANNNAIELGWKLNF